MPAGKKQNKKLNSPIEDLKSVPQDVYIFPNGEKYSGEFAHLEDGTIERCGYGEHVTVNGMILKGEWKNDKLNGKGTVIYPSGAVYEGDLVNNTMHGNGKYIFTDLSVYEGPFIHNKVEGDGTYTDASRQTWCGKFNVKSANDLEFKLNM